MIGRLYRLYEVLRTLVRPSDIFIILELLGVH